jgi:hypothetical protein
MAFFPPTGAPNNTLRIIDDKYVFETGGPERFAPLTRDVTVYWPWLSWDQEDVTIADHQQAIMRCCVHGDWVSYGLVPDGIGAIVRIGDPANQQLWEIIHYFEWYLPADPLKKLTLLWCRLWQVVAPTVITPETNCFLAPELEEGVTYLVEGWSSIIPGWLIMPAVIGTMYHVTFSHVAGDDVLLSIFDGDCSLLFGPIVASVGPGCYSWTYAVTGASSENVVLRIESLGSSTYTVRVGIGPCP